MNIFDALKDAEQQLEDRYLKSLCDLYLFYNARREDQTGTTPLQRWNRSSMLRDAFCWANVRAQLVNQPTTQSELSKTLSVSRQSVSDMIKTCVAQDWIFCFCDGKLIPNTNINDCKGSLTYWAGDEMMFMAREFINRHIQSTEDTFLNSNWDDLMGLRKAMKALR